MDIMQTFPLDNTPYTASELGSWLATRTAGVFSNNGNLDVIANGDMTVTLTAGLCWLKHSEFWGVSSLLSNNYALVIDTADGVLNRIDNIVIRLDKIQNKAYPAVVKGAVASVPIRTPPQRNANVFEIIIATVYVGAGTIALNQSNVMDTRLDETVCGIMRDGVTGIPTNTLYSQAQALINDLVKAIEEIKSHIIPDGSVTKLKLSTDVQAEITNSTTHLASQATHVLTLTHSKSSTVHTLTGIPTASGIYTAQFKAVADYLQGNTFNGYTAKPVGEDTAMPNKAFVTGDLVTVVVDTQSKKLGFKVGGGGANDTLPSQVKNLTATAGNAKVTLAWTNPTTGFAGLVIMRKASSQPIGVTDGTKVYEGTGASFVDTGVINDTTYYYRAFPYNAKKQYQTDIVGAVVSALPRAEPTNYTYLTSFNASTNWSCPESGYYQVFCFGASGNGGKANSIGRAQGKGGGGGASGGLSIHKLFIEQGTVIPITANTSVTSFGTYCTATAGASAVDKQIIGATSVGTASGGNVLNAQGGAGGAGGVGGNDYASVNGANGGTGNQSNTIGNGGQGGLGAIGIPAEDYVFRGGNGGGGGGVYAPSKYTLKMSKGGNGTRGSMEVATVGDNGQTGHSNVGTNSVKLSGGGGGGGGAGASNGGYTNDDKGGSGGTGAPATVIIEKGVYS